MTDGRVLDVPRVAIITSNFWPDVTGISATITEFAVFLREHGCAVDVVTAMPYYPEWSIRADYRGMLSRREEYRGVRIRRAWHFVRPRLSTAMRLVHEASLALMAVPGVIRTVRGADTVFVVSPTLSLAFVGSLVSRLSRRRLVLVVKDVMPDAAVELGMLRSRVAITMSRWMARRLYRWADEIHTLGEGMRRRIAADTAKPDKIRLVPDTVDGSELGPVPEATNEFRRRYVPPGAFAIVHTGNMGRKQDLDLILRTAQLLQGDPSIRFYVFGDGAVKEEFLAKRDRLGLGSVTHYPLQERDFLKQMLSGADVVLVSQLRQVVDIVVPSKLLTAMACGAMVIAACPGASEPARILAEAGGGIVIPAEDEQALAATIRGVRAGKVDVAMHRRRVREYAVRTFDRAAVYGPIAAALHEGSAHIGGRRWLEA